MRLCVDGPDVARILLKGKAGLLPGRPEVSVLLEAEGMHSPDEPVNPDRRRPGPLHTVNNLAEFMLLPDEEIQVLGNLECKEIVRIMKQGTLEEAGRTIPFTLGPRLGSQRVQEFTLARFEIPRIEIGQDVLGSIETEC